MKKMVVILILTSSWLVSSGQKHPPVQPYNESGYSNLQFEKFALNLQSELSMDYSDKLFSLAVPFLKETGLYEKYVDQLSIKFLLDPSRTWAEYRIYENIYENGFWNSRQTLDGKGVEFYLDTTRFEGMIMVLHLDGYELDLAKTICMNLVNVPYWEPVPVNTNTTIYTSPSSMNWVFKEPKKEVQSNFYIPPVKKEKKIKVGPIVIGGTALLAGLIVGGIYLANQSNDNGGNGNTNDDDGGGPGGAPPTTGFGFSFGF